MAQSTTFHIDPKVRRKLERIAKAEEASLGHVIRTAIRRDLDRRAGATA